MSELKFDNYNQAGFINANSVKYVRVDDTPTNRKDITVTRKPAVYNSSTRQFSIPEYRIAIRKDTQDGDGLPTNQRLTIDLTIRTPLYGDADQLEQARQELLAIASASNFADIINRQLFPAEGEESQS